MWPRGEQRPPEGAIESPGERPRPLPAADSLRAALDGLLDGVPSRQAASAVERLIAHYRGATPTDTPILRDRADVAAYAAYRMPATFEAVHSALRAFAEAVPGWAPGVISTWAAGPARRRGP